MLRRSFGSPLAQIRNATFVSQGYLSQYRRARPEHQAASFPIVDLVNVGSSNWKWPWELRYTNSDIPALVEGTLPLSCRAATSVIDESGCPSFAMNGSAFKTAAAACCRVQRCGEDRGCCPVSVKLGQRSIPPSSTTAINSNRLTSSS
jgi:hypothetical protein